MICRHKWPLIPSPTAASLSLQPVSEYRIQRQSGSERSFRLDFTVNANGVGTPGVQGELGVAGRFLLTRMGGMYISYIHEKQVLEVTEAAI
jgi:hypothetical protein